MTKTIHVVMGTTGEYSDRGEWPVRAYFDEGLAQAHVANATEAARVFYAERNAKPHNPDYRVPTGANPYDPDMAMDYTGTTYYLLTVQLEEAGAGSRSPRKGGRR
jgi:hypothetical protein